MTKFIFERPNYGFADSYRSMVGEFLANGEELVPFPLTFPNEDFAAFLAELEACSQGEGRAAGFVPHSTYWLVKDDVVVAVSNLRHRLTKALRREGGTIGYGVRPSARRRGFATEILRRTLQEAWGLGLKEVLITCADTNEGSIRAILKNGGALESKEFLPERGETVHRYLVYPLDNSCERPER
ncbi:MAG: GNAT family N-acetyltransferase [Acidimicrobiia bacterium]